MTRRYLAVVTVAMLGLACTREPASRVPPPPPTSAADSLKADLADHRFRAIVTVREHETDTATTLPPDRIRALASEVAERHGLEVLRIFSIIPAFVTVVDTTRVAALLADGNVRRVEPDRLVRTQRNRSTR